MRCLIIGGGGFIGRSLGNAAVAAGHDVVGLDVTNRAADETVRFPIRRGDVRTGDLELPDDVDVVWYLAQSPCHRAFPRRAGDLFAVNVAGAVQAAEAAQARGARFFGYASTGTVYAPGFDPMSESRAVRRDRPYPLSKVCAERALALFEGVMPVLVVRLFGVFGPGQRAALVPGITDRIRTGTPVTIQPHPRDSDDRDGLRISLSFVDDVSRCILELTGLALAGQRVEPLLNVAADRPVSIRGLAERIGTALDRAPRFEIAERPRESDYVADVARLRSLIDARFTPFPEALNRTLAIHV